MRVESGTTLVELLIVLGLLGILLFMAMPGFGALLQETKGDATMRTLAGHIALARSTAITSQQRVTFCPSADQRQCGGSWAQGSIVFTDRNSDRRVNQDDALIRVRGPLATGETLRWRAFQNRQYLQMEPSGFMRYQSGNFTLCPVSRDARFAQQLVVNGTGRTRMAQDRNGDGFREDSSGNPLRCD